MTSERFEAAALPVTVPSLQGWSKSNSKNNGEDSLQGILYTYANDISTNPLHRYYLSHCLIALPAVDISDIGSEYHVQITEENSETTTFTLSGQDASLWCAAINAHKQVATTPIAPSEIFDEDIESSNIATMQIHLKGEPHFIQVRPEDDVSVIAETFVEQHKLKQEIKPRIETELLRTQIDASLAYQVRLKKHMSMLRRRVFESLEWEARAQAAEKHAAALVTHITQMESRLPQLKSMLSVLVAEVEEKNASLSTSLHRQMQLQSQLEQLIHDNASQQNTISNLKDKLSSLLEINSLRRTDSAIIAEALSARSSTSQRTQPSAAETSVASEREKRLEAEIAALQDSNVHLEALLTDSRCEVAELQLQIANLPSELEEKHRLKLQEVADSYESKMRGWKQKASEAEQTKNVLQVKFERLSLTADTSSRMVAAKEKELAAAMEELTKLREEKNNKLLLTMTEENRVLRDQAVKLRGEVMRLQSQIDEVKESAIHAVQAMQLMGPDVNMTSLTANGSNNKEFNGQVSQQANETNFQGTTSQLDAPSHQQDDVSYTVEVHLDEPSVQEFGSSEILKESLRNDRLNALMSMKLEELSAAALSPVVEDRLLRNIHAHYSHESLGQMTLSRFGRFAKEFGISAGGDSKTLKPPYLIYGDIDLVFSIITKDQEVVHVGEESEGRLSRSQPAFVAGSKYLTPQKSRTLGASGAGKLLSATQFIAAVRELAIRLYSSVIEKLTGTVYTCLPQQQREKASRAAMDVMMLKKIMPAADRLQLVPWPLMILDQTLTVVHSSDVVSHVMVANLHRLSSWYSHYCSASSSPKESPVRYASPTWSSTLSRTPQKIKSITGVTYKAFSKFFHDFGIIPYLLKESQVYNLYTEIGTWKSRNVELLLVALPPDIRNHPAVLQEQTMATESKPDKITLGLGTFCILFCASSMQAFSDMPTEQRLSKLFDWAAQSGGSYLVQKQHSN